jgi:formamidopyrimidine-DNA glycosylase
MPELPDISVYVERLEALLEGQELTAIQINNPFVLRSVEPGIADLLNHRVTRVSRLGKRIVLALEPAYFIVMHLMIAGRLQWRKSPLQRSRSGQKPAGRGRGLAVLEFSSGALTLTEAGKKRRASLHLVQGENGLKDFDRGGLEVFEVDLDEFKEALVARNHTLKRALTDPRILSGIGNAYSDEILHRAGLSPFRQTQKMTAEEFNILYGATRDTLSEWLVRLREETGEGFPAKVTAFRPGMAVHGRFREPCPSCGSPVQRIVYAQNECNYCARCQTGGKLLADRALSRLLKANWPKTLEELEDGDH